MNRITVDLDLGLWIDSKGHVLLYLGDDPQEVEAVSISELIKRSIDAHKFPSDITLDRDEAKKFVKLKKELTKCLDYVNYELTHAK